MKTFSKGNSSEKTNFIGRNGNKRVDPGLTIWVGETSCMVYSYIIIFIFINFYVNSIYEYIL